MVKKRCDICNKDYADLRKHQQRVHGVARFGCPYCDATFTRIDNRNRHVAHNHPGAAVLVHAADTDEPIEDLPESLPSSPGALVIDERNGVNSNDSVEPVAKEEDDDDRMSASTPSEEPGPSNSRRRKTSGDSGSSKRRALSPVLIEETDDIEDFDENDEGSQLRRDIERENWSSIRTHADENQRSYNVRLRGAGINELFPLLDRLHLRQRFAYRINVMPGLILRNIETGLLRYFRPGESNRAFEQDLLIRNTEDFDSMILQLKSMDMEQIGFEARPDTKWVLLRMTNLMVNIFPVPSVPIGAPILLPSYITNNRGLQNFLRDCNDHDYTDSKCAFRCVAAHFRDSRRKAPRQTAALSVDDQANMLFRNFHTNCLGVAPPSDEDFHGLTLQDLDKLEKFLKLPIWVYRLCPRIDKRLLLIKRRKRRRTKPKRKAIRQQGLRGQRRRRKLPRNPFILDEAEEGQEEDDNAEVGGENSEQIDDDQEQQEAILQKKRELEADAIRKSRFSAELVRRPAKGIIRGAERDTGALLLNVYEDGHAAHFSRISSMDFYAKCFSCSNEGCIRSFAHRKGLLRHIKTCKGATIKDLYPGNGFVIPFTIFEKLENLLGITVPEEDQYYPYCACFDMESFTDVADIEPFTRVVSLSPPFHPLPPVVIPESVTEPPTEASDFVKANWMTLHSRLGASNDYCVINSPAPGQVQDALVGMAELQIRAFRLVLAVFYEHHGKLQKRRVALSDEISSSTDFQAFLPSVSTDRIQKVLNGQKLLAARIDVYLSKKPFTGNLVPASFSVATTVPAFEDEDTGKPKPFFMLSDGDPRKLIKKLVDILYEFSTEAGRVIRHGVHGRILQDLTDRWLNELVKMHEVLLNFIKERLPKIESRLATVSNTIDRSDANLAEMREEKAKLLAKIQRLTEAAIELGDCLRKEAEGEDKGEDSHSEGAEDEGHPDFRIFLDEPKAIVQSLFKDLPYQVKREYYHHRAMMHTIRDLYGELERWVHCLPVFGFNSGKFDLGLIREWLLPILKAREDEPVHVHDLPQEPAPSKLFIDTVYRKMRVTPLKRGNTYLSLATNRLRFLDMAKFCAEGTSLDDWLKSQRTEQQKFFWPHDYFTGLHVLDDPLPTREEFFSQLKNKGLSEEEYALVVDKWRIENWTCLREHLEYYNNMDVLPFLEGIDKMRANFREEFKVDVLGGQCITLPGLAERCLYKQIPRHINFVLPQRTRGKNNSDLFEIMRRDTVGGPAIVNRRLAIAGTDRIRNPVNGNIIKKIVGFDANSLYPWSSAQPQATQVPKRWDLQPDGSFRGERFYNKTQSETEFLEWESFCRGDVPIYHRFNGGVQLFGRKTPRNPNEEKPEFDESDTKELRIMGIRVDGYCPKTKTCFFFDGCLYHGHGCPVKYTTRNPMSERSEAERLKGNQARIRDQAQRKALAAAGYEVVVMTECEWTHQKKENSTPIGYLSARHLEMHECEFYKHHSPDAYKEAQPEDSNGLNLKDFLAKYFDLPKHPKFDNFNKILDEIRKDRFFGIVVCDLHVPEELRAHYAEQPPIFKNAKVCLDDIGEHMRGLAMQHGWLRRPQRSLIGSYKCTEMAIITPLLKWYLEPEHGLVCTKIYQAFEFKPMAPFSDFVATAAEKRRESDKNPNLAANANTWKLAINSIYGKSITNKDRFEDCFVLDETTAEEKAAQKLFRRQIRLDNELVEVSMAKKQVVHNLNAMFGFFVYGYSKMRMLQFHFDFVMKFISPERIELILQDTDSHYYAIDGDCIDDLVPDELKTAYLAEKYNFLPHEDEPRKTYDNRTPGIFKIERVAKAVAALSAKCHCLLDFDDQSIAKHKGVSHRQNKFIMKHYQDVLNTTRSISGNVEQIVTSPDSRGLVRQSTTKKALSYSYFKRQVQDDGIRTLPLLI